MTIYLKKMCLKKCQERILWSSLKSTSHCDWCWLMFQSHDDSIFRNNLASIGKDSGPYVTIRYTS